MSLFFPLDIWGEPGLLLSKGLSHYAREMEFYYVKPRPDIIPGLFKSMQEAGALGQNEKRLMLGAFFAALAAERQLDLEALAPLARSLGKDAVKTLAWSLHLGKGEEGAAIIESLLADNRALIRQIEESPAPLSKWPLLGEPVTLRMYWMAFMATGNEKWLDDIIGGALEYGRLKSQGRWQEHDYQVGKMAASSLFEFAKNHSRVRQRVQDHLRGNKNQAETELLRQILQN